MTEPVELTYALHPPPPGRISFRRWRWELWHDPNLLAAGWRLTPAHAQRALRAHAYRYVHRLHGLHPLHADAAPARELPWAGMPAAFTWGDLRVVLKPRALRDAA